MYHFHPQVVLRTPVYSHSTFKEANLPSQLADPYFKAAIFLASKSLYQELEKKGFEYAALDQKTIYALKKYLNRMSFRPTPFGLFSGFSTAYWGADGMCPLLLRRESLKMHVEVDFKNIRKITEELLGNELAPYQTYTSNPSLYRVQDEYRYLRFERDFTQGTKNFLIDSFGCQKLLTKIISFCKTAQRQADVVSFILQRSSTSQEESAAFFSQLVSQQILVSTLQENITGEDYLLRLMGICHSFAIETPRTISIREWLDKLKTMPDAKDIISLSTQIFNHNTIFVDNPKEKPPLYVILEKELVAGDLSQVYQKNIQEGLHCLSRLLPSQKPQGLQNFVNAFKQKFEHRTVPLLEALDPEIGIGYEDLAASYQCPKLLQDIAFAPSRETNPMVEWTPAHALLLDKWVAATGTNTDMQLNEQDLEGLPSQEDGRVMPPSISVLFRISKGKVYMEQAGGVSATALLGRFTPFNQAVFSMAKEVARHEEEANPSVIFAEIAHFCHEHSANIDRRETIRSFEIPVLVQSTLAQDQQIPLSDLWVRVEKDHILLLSRQLQKVVVPRLSSAFNYRRNDLSVFRFLCDLQYQGVKANFTLELSSFFPGLKYYPRITYKSAILHLAIWHLKKEQLSLIAEAPVDQRVARLKDLAATLNWPQHIALTEHDHQLVFDLENETDIALFGDTLKNKAAVMVKEFPFVDEQEALVTDENQKHYIHQFLTALYHSREVYPGYAFEAKGLEKNFKKRFEKKRKLLPGSEWLYFKLYCHPSRSNQLLTESLLPVLHLLLKKRKVKQWFFVRYRDPDYHLRVRLCLADQDTGGLLGILRHKLSKLVQKGTLRDFQVAVYERELERYTPELIEKVEDVFCADSALVAAYLKEVPFSEADYPFYRNAFSGLALILHAFGLDLPERVQLLHQLYEAFYKEFGGTNVLRDQLSRTFREIDAQKDILPPYDTPETVPFSHRKRNMRFRDSLQAVAQKTKHFSPAKKTGFIADLMHLHLNRLFTDQARKQELVVYYCLWRYYKSAQARAKS